jgi:hypothetical protein
MPTRVETDTVIYVSGSTPGTEGEQRRDLQIGFPIDGPKIAIHAGPYGTEVEIPDLREALERAEEVQKMEGLI